ncbi:MAG: tryptophan--tRNA ligase, partial [Elusimicrobiota bacterium]|nr:tryptophan--tRNA ligase [Elusimicrobiota bacterium]
GYGFLGYPVLMAADILLYRADTVPVGADQLAHIELCREIARRFNNFYGNVLVEPNEKLTKESRVPGIDGRKMSKSYGNSIFLGEDDDVLKKKVFDMFTDPKKIKKDDAGHPEACVVFAFYEIFNPTGGKAETKKAQCKAGEMGCISCKRQVLEHLVEFMRPLTKKRKELMADKQYLEKMWADGAKKANETAQETMTQIRKAVKF